MARPKKAGGGNQSELIRLAIAGIDAQIRELQEKRAELARGAAGGARTTVAKAAGAASATKTRRRRRQFSAETRARLAESARKRWARFRAEKKGAKKSKSAAKSTSKGAKATKAA